MNKTFTIFILSIALMITGLESKAQEFRRVKGTTIVCYASTKIADPKNYIFARNKFLQNRTNARTAGISSNIEITLSGLPEDPTDAIDYANAMQYAVNIWASLLASPMPIKITANWTPLANGTVLATASATNDIVNFEGAPIEDFFYPIALAEKNCQARI